MPRRALAPLCLLLLTACFERPVQEKLEVSFAEDGSAVVRLEVTFASGTREQAARDRLSMMRRE